MSDEARAVFHKLVKAGAKQAVKQGGKKMDLPDEVSDLLADQLAFTYELLKTGAKLTSGELMVRLIHKEIGIARLATDQRFDCGIALVVLAAALTQTALYTTVTGPISWTWNAVSLLSDCYSVDKACGISEKMMDEVAIPAATWLEQGVIQWLNRGH